VPSPGLVSTLRDDRIGQVMGRNEPVPNAGRVSHSTMGRTSSTTFTPGATIGLGP
jgi:hypothetical protein